MGLGQNLLNTPTLLSGAYVAGGVAGQGTAGNKQDGTLIGSGDQPNDLTHTSLTASMTLANPNSAFTGALSGYADYTGQPGASQGSLQGGSCVSRLDMGSATGNITPTVLGWETLVEGVGTTAHTATELISLQTTAYVQDTVTVTTLIGYHGRAPFSNGGTPTVTDAYCIKAEEPTVGTNTWTFYGAGRHAFSKGTASHVVEINASGDLLQWSNDGSKWQGYASDGVSQRILIDPTDTAAQRILVTEGGSMTGPSMQINTNSHAALAVQNLGSAVLAQIGKLGNFQPGNGTTVGGSIWSGSGAPSIASSATGDIYFRIDTPSTANQRVYIATAANTWTGIL